MSSQDQTAFAHLLIDRNMGEDKIVKTIYNLLLKGYERVKVRKKKGVFKAPAPVAMSLCVITVLYCVFL